MVSLRLVQVKVGASVILLLISGVFLIALTNGVNAQQVNWVSITLMKDLTGNVVVQSGQPLLVGHSYNLTVTIDVPFSQPATEFQVMLSADMKGSGSQFWYIQTNKYGGYDPSKFTPAAKSISFKQVEGKLVLSAIFSIPTELTISAADKLVLRFVKADYPVINVTVTGGSIVGRAQFRISDSAIEKYLDTYAMTSNLIPAGKIDKAYSVLVANVLQNAQFLYQIGLPERATTILEVINASNLPAPPDTSYVILLIAGIVVVAVVAAASFIMYIRGRTRFGFVEGIVGDVQRELAGLEVTAAKIDKNLADRLKILRDKLSEGL